MSKVRLADYYPLLKETLETGGTFSLTVTGTSMYPFILGNRDKVTLSAITQPLRKYDVPLYRRDDGTFVLHRIIRVEKDGTYTCCGDHQWWQERGLRRDQMIGIATSYVRKGKKLTNRNVLYRLYAVIWTWLLKYRYYIFAFRPWLSAKLKRKK